MTDRPDVSILMGLIGTETESATFGEISRMNPRKSEDAIREILTELEEQGELEEHDGKWRFTEKGRREWNWLWQGKDTLRALHESVDWEEDNDERK
ncbi:hypothetical protein ACFQE1_01550 [Halobium palmae]|uniref:Uncharacterized protein n=1 Tax=Halobium palmae TaxID=1776492 RepID=A0ABD5RUQ2_9EURY